jgi:hypothetical protein
MDKQEFSVKAPDAFNIVWVGKPLLQIEAGKLAKSEFFLRVEIGKWKSGEKVPVTITEKGGDEETIKTSFIQPE